ncbi:flagellar operon protein TIGR03826 [Alteribacillus persepolensis]|uniref:Flagellar operon protein TIGR03826 n=1 Tax=Alteribacillus persepolensis TaxID=568899 RepID=A0A1G8AEU4_9BACI|nr:TIGR03826 family flagellar region protein [Alteribacillus persepolensis]SDH19403.1 flagellar operon protein TIGR03826 [Alteribacillus persepolensis]
MEHLKNCPRCGRLFVKSLRAICNDCHRAIEEKFQKVYAYMRKQKNRSATMMRVVEATGVEKEDISQFIKEGRLHIQQFPNLEYPCESCGKGIRAGRICQVCKDDIENGLKAETVAKDQKEREEQEKKRHLTYQTLHERLK